MNWRHVRLVQMRRHERPDHEWIVTTFRERRTAIENAGAICGHAPASMGRGYGEFELTDKARELRKFPRYKSVA